MVTLAIIATSRLFRYRKNYPTNCQRALPAAGSDLVIAGHRQTRFAERETRKINGSRICRRGCVYDVLVCGCYIIKKLRGRHEPRRAYTPPSKARCARWCIWAWQGRRAPPLGINYLVGTRRGGAPRLLLPNRRPNKRFTPTLQ